MKFIQLFKNENHIPLSKHLYIVSKIKLCFKYNLSFSDKNVYWHKRFSVNDHSLILIKIEKFVLVEDYSVRHDKWNSSKKCTLNLFWI